MALTNKLTAIANAIRTKTGGSAQLSLDDMVTEIEGISGGEAEPVNITLYGGTMSDTKGALEKMLDEPNVNFLATDGMDGMVDQVPKLMMNISKSRFPNQNDFLALPSKIYSKWKKKFYLATEKNVMQPTLDVAFFATGDTTSVSNSIVWKIPYIIEDFDIGDFFILPTRKSGVNYYVLYNHLIIHINTGAYSNENSIRTIYDNLRPLIKKISDKNNVFKNWLISNQNYIRATTGGYGCPCFAGQWYLEDLPEWYPIYLQILSKSQINYASDTKFMYYECYKMKTAYFPNVPTSLCAHSFKNTPRLRHIIFIGDGQLSNSGNFRIEVAGYNRTSGTVTDKQDVCPDNKKIYDATSYEALKNDPDAWASGIEWSFYGHTAAAETLASLPDQTTPYNRPCTIYLESNSGLNTDDGPISDLTAEEIAIATNKGWTVTFI